MGIIEVLEIKARLTLLREAIVKKNTIQVPKTKEEALKPIPKKSQEAIDSLEKGIECISAMIELNNKLCNQNEKLEKRITQLSFDNGVLKNDKAQLKRVNERLLKSVKI